LSLGEMVVTGEDALAMIEALNPTSLKILQLLSKNRLDVSTVAKRLGFGESYASEQIQVLDDLKLVKVSYGRGKKGIRKICQSAVNKITIVIDP